MTTPTPKPWVRLRACSTAQFQALARTHERLTQGTVTTGRLRCLRWVEHQAQLTDVLWSFDKGQLVTLENASAAPWQPPHSMPACPTHTARMLLDQLTTHIAQVLDRIAAELAASDQVAGPRAMPDTRPPQQQLTEEMGSYEQRIDLLLGFVMDSVSDIERCVRQLSQPPRPAPQGEALLKCLHVQAKRARALRQRLWNAGRTQAEATATSDLGITKLFTVLWAAFIPGTALINWYGQNFEVMPELSWEGSLWSQLLAVLALTAVPIWMIKQAGALR